MRTVIAYTAALLTLGACRGPLGDLVPAAPVAHETETLAPTINVATLGDGAAPGNKHGPGGFVSRGKAGNFYAGAGGRLWYYMNNYYWAPESAPRDDLWIKAVVVEEWVELRKWPDGAAAASPVPKVTAEYWRVGSTGRSVRLDNHKDYCLLAEKYTAGAVTVEVTLTLGRVDVKDARDRWGRPKQAYVLESRNYRGGGGIGADNARFEALPTEAETVWSYRVPWDTHPQPLTRSNWKRLELPEWGLRERRAPPRPSLPVRAPVITPGDSPPDGS